MFFDPIYLLFIAPAFLLSLWAQYRVKSTYHAMSEVAARSGLTGADVARTILRRSGVRGVEVEPVDGFLSDHYSPGEKMLRLSPEVYSGRSVAALGIAAHEVGHAIQDARGYKPLVLRQTLAPLATLGSNLSWVLLALGLLLQSFQLVVGGIVVFSAGVVFTLITLPVEYDASARAKRILVEEGLISASERPMVARVLDAAALTYVAAALMALSQLLYFVFRAMALSSRSD